MSIDTAKGFDKIQHLFMINKAKFSQNKGRKEIPCLNRVYVQKPVVKA